MRPILIRFVLAGLFAAGSLVGVASSQVLYGSIVGNVTDPQGAVLTAVSVTITNTGTGLKLNTVTDDTGAYIFRNLLPGTYSISLSAKGFKDMQQEDVIVTAGNPKRVDVKLQIGAAQETVTVTASAATLRTEKADLTTELNSLQVTSLPLNQYRNYQTLLNLVPGATPVQFQNAEIDTLGRSLRTWVNGTQPNSNTTRVDGAVSVNVWLPHHAGYIQPVETIETVNIATNNFDADTGMAAGAAQTVVTKSGTNEFHGSAFEFYNGDKLNANSFFNNAGALARPPQTRHTYGGTLGGPILKEKLFFFGSYEKFRDRRGFNFTSSVPTDKMRNGDFTEVAAVYPIFKLYDPNSGATGGVGRTQFANSTIPGNLISPLAKAIMNFYPKVNSTIDLNKNGFLDDYVKLREVQVDRANYDSKITWQRSRDHSIWGKVSLLRANVVDNYSLGFDNGSLGDTKVYVVSAGHTWTISPTLLLDGNFGYYRMDQTVTGPDFGKNLGLDLGIPGVNDPKDTRASGLPTFDFGGTYNIGTTPNWMPLYRKEINWSFSSALTKIFAKHEVRVGVDIVKLELNHRQAEFGDYGLKGGFSFSASTTGASGYIAPGGGTWNSFAGFLLGTPSFYSKDVQTETMTGREWQNALYLRDRWRVTQNLTLNLGLRLENYPLMSRAKSGLERLDYSTYTVLLGGRGNVPKDVGLKLQTWYLAPRLGAAYRIGEKSVARAGYGRTINPLPWSRPLRGSFPYDITFNNTADQFGFVTTLASGIPAVPIPDFNSGRVQLPVNVFMRSPNFGAEAFPGSGKGLDRAVIQQWNVAYERKLPGNIITEVAYVGTRTDGGYADLNINYGEPGPSAGSNARRKYFAVAGATAINDWGARTKARYNSLQVALNRPFSSGLMLKGAYTLSRAKGMTDEDGWVGLTWNHPLKFADNFALAGFDRTHIFQMGFVYELPFLKKNSDLTSKLLGGLQLNGIYAIYSGTPFGIGGTNNDLNCAGCGGALINVNGDPKPIGQVGSATETYYDKSLFSQPTGTAKDGFGTSRRNQFRRPRVWNLDLSMFKQFRVKERFQPEFRVEAVNVFNHTNWGAPVTGFTANNFLQFTPGSAENGTNTPGTRRIQVGVRVTF